MRRNGHENQLYMPEMSSNDGGEIDRFQCIGCGWVIQWEFYEACRRLVSPITDYQDLHNWLKIRGMLGGMPEELARNSEVK